jgi:hypothetical protein
MAPADNTGPTPPPPPHRHVTMGSHMPGSVRPENVVETLLTEFMIRLIRDMQKKNARDGNIRVTLGPALFGIHITLDANPGYKEGACND